MYAIRSYYALPNEHLGAVIGAVDARKGMVLGVEDSYNFV